MNSQRTPMNIQALINLCTRYYYDQITFNEFMLKLAEIGYLEFVNQLHEWEIVEGLNGEEIRRLKQDILLSINDLQQFQGRAANLRAHFNIWNPKRDKTVSLLQSIVTALDQNKSSSNYIKTASTGVGMLGSVAFVAGVLAAPYTAGLSLALTVGGASAGAAGGVTILATKGVEWWKDSNASEKAQAIIVADKTATDDLRSCLQEFQTIMNALDRLTQAIQTLASNCTPKYINRTTIGLAKAATNAAPPVLFAMKPHILCTMESCLVTDPHILEHSVCDAGRLGANVSARTVGGILATISLVFDTIELVSTINDIKDGSHSQYGRQISEYIEMLEKEQNSMRQLFESTTQIY